MNNFLNEFEERFRAGFLDDLKSILEEVKNEKVYACAFGTDSDFVTLFLAVNTEESLVRHITNMKAEACATARKMKIIIDGDFANINMAMQHT